MIFGDLGEKIKKQLDMKNSFFHPFSSFFIPFSAPKRNQTLLLEEKITFKREGGGGIYIIKQDIRLYICCL